MVFKRVLNRIMLNYGEFLLDFNGILCMLNVDNAYYNYEVNDTRRGKHTLVLLYSDSAKTVPVSDRDVDVIYEYELPAW